MNYRSEARVVIRWDVANLALLLRVRVDVAIGAADKPENRRRAPFGSERSEILAGRCRAGLLYTINRKVKAKRIAYSLGCLGVVPDKRITIQRSDLWLLRRAGGFSFRIDNALDRSKHPLPDGLVKRAHVQFDNCLVWDDVFFRAGLQRTDCDHCRVGSRNFTRDDRLKTKHSRSRHDDRVNAGLRHRSMSASPEHSDLQAIARRGHNSRARAQYASGPDHNVLP